MKFRTHTEQYDAPHTVDGVTETVTRTRQIRVPVLPRDWDTIGVRAATGCVLALTVVSVAWSTWSIGSLLHGGIGYAAASIFDVAWAVTLILEYLARFDPAKRTFPRRLGWALLLATMGAIFWHGMERHSAGMAVVGAAVSLFAKVLWLGVMKHVDRELSSDDAQWVARQISKANATLAIASVRRQVARVEHQAAAELLALEAQYGVKLPQVAAEQADDAEPLEPSGATPAATEGARTSVALPAGGSVQLGPEDVAALLAAIGATDQQAPGVASATDAEQVDDADDAAYDVADATDDDAEPLEPPTLASLSKADAVRIALRKRPGYSARQVADLLGGYGVTVTDSYVRQVRLRDEASARAAASQDADTVVHLRKA